MPTEAEIDAAARAEYDSDYPKIFVRPPWDDLHARVKAWRRDRAKAALEAAERVRWQPTACPRCGWRPSEHQMQ